MTRVCPSVCPQGRGGGQSADSARGGQSADSAGGGGGKQGGVSRGEVSAGGRGQPGGESAKIGQQNEYSLHSGRYASCVHAGGLSSCEIDLF